MVDGMLKRLSLKLRNFGFDSTFVENMGYKEKVQQCEEQKRVLITKDKTLLQVNKACPLIRMISTKPDVQVEEIIKIMKITLDPSKFLSRCNKCNHHELLVIAKEIAFERMNWEDPDSVDPKTLFYQCPICLQIYYEGGQFDRAKKQYNKFNDDQKKVEEQDDQIQIDDDKNIAKIKKEKLQ